MDKLFVTISGIGVIIFIYWFFFKSEDSEEQETKQVVVSGGYKPKKILIPAGKTTNITFLRTDPNNCLEDVIIPEFGIKQYLPLNKKVIISLTPPGKGTYDIHCGMNMFHGQIKTL